MQGTIQETVYYVVHDGKTLAKYFEADRAQRFANTYNEMDGVGEAVVVAAELAGHALAGSEVPA